MKSYTCMKETQRGQILIPFLFVLPSLMLVLFFLVEVGRLSREKIRNQFALDISATLEMEQYNDVLNRLAYVNGVFPERVFRQVYGPNWQEFYSNGLYPGAPAPMSEDEAASLQNWPIQFGPGRSYANVPDPPNNFGILHLHLPGGTIPSLATATQQALAYFAIYGYLGDLAVAHKQVFEKSIEQQHALLRKSIWMNLGASGPSQGCTMPQNCGDEAASGFQNIHIRFHFVSGFKHCPVAVIINGQTYSGELAGHFNFGGNGLFQLATVPQQDLDLMQKGYIIKQHWIPPKNLFSINLHAFSPYVRATVTSYGGRVWPMSTPKYYTRMYP